MISSDWFATETLLIAKKKNNGVVFSYLVGFFLLNMVEDSNFTIKFLLIEPHTIFLLKAFQTLVKTEISVNIACQETYESAFTKI